MEQDINTGAVIVCALRYCVGRRTYMPSLVIEWAKRHWALIDIKTQNTIYKDLVNEINSGRNLGDDCDIGTWKRFYVWMSVSIFLRESTKPVTENIAPTGLMQNALSFFRYAGVKIEELRAIASEYSINLPPEFLAMSSENEQY